MKLVACLCSGTSWSAADFKEERNNERMKEKYNIIAAIKKKKNKNG